MVGRTPAAAAGNASASPGEAEQLDLADQLDSAGRHDEAIGVLSAAATAGSAVARGRVGARILVGDRAPWLPADGAGLILEAADAGSAEAAALAAVLAGAGAHRRQSWADALVLLARAAALGFEPARRQLLILSGDGDLAHRADAGTAAPDSAWGTLAAEIDIGRLTTPVSGRTLNDEPLIRAFADFASPAACRWLIEKSRGRLVRAAVYNVAAGRNEVREMRTNTTATFNLAQSDLVQLFVQARIAAAIGVPLAHLEGAGVLHYDVGEQISDHYDFVDPQQPGYSQQIALSGQRFVTFLLYLNDDYDAGETDFPRLGLRHKGVAGEGLFFTNALASRAADERSLHAGRPPTRGEKWILSQFVRDRPVLPGVGV